MPTTRSVAAPVYWLKILTGAGTRLSISSLTLDSNGASISVTIMDLQLRPVKTKMPLLQLLGTSLCLGSDLLAPGLAEPSCSLLTRPPPLRPFHDALDR